MSSRRLPVLLLAVVCCPAVAEDRPTQRDLVFSRDGTRLAIDTTKGVVLWDVQKQQKLRVLGDRFKSPAISAAFSPDGKWFAARRLWSLSNPPVERRWPPIVYGKWGPPTAFAADERTYLATTPQHVFRVDRDVPAGFVEIRDVAEGESFDVLAGDASGKKVAVAGMKDERPFLELWDLSGDEPRRTVVLKGHVGGITSLEFAKDGKRLLSGSWDETVRLWDVASGECVRVFRGHVYTVYFAQFGEDEKTVRSGSYSGEVREWDAASGKLLRSRTKQNSLAAVTRDGKRIAWSAGDGKVRIERLGDGKLLQEIDLTSLAEPVE